MIACVVFAGAFLIACIYTVLVIIVGGKDFK